MSRDTTKTRNSTETRRMSCGFTLVEIIMVSVIVIVVAGGFLTAFLTGQTSYLSSDSAVQVQYEARRAFDAMVRELRQARVNAGTVITTLADGTRQLNFQVAKGYNLTTDPNCPVNDVCWGSEAQSTTGWVHYSIIGAAGNNRQLIRCINTDETGAVEAYAAASCRVLANAVLTTAGVDNFSYDANNRFVTINLQIEVIHPGLPTGRYTAPRLTTRVRLRN